MTIEIEPLDVGPRAIFEIGILTQIPEIIVNDLLNTIHKSEEEILKLIEDRGYRVGEGSHVEIPQELTSTMKDFDLTRHSIINGKGLAVATIGILKGDKEKLNRLNNIIEKWTDEKDSRT